MFFSAVYSAQRPAKRAFRSTQRESTTSRTTRSTSPVPPARSVVAVAVAVDNNDSTCHLAIWQFALRFGRVACACSNAKLIQYYFCFFSVFNSSFMRLCVCVHVCVFPLFFVIFVGVLKVLQKTKPKPHSILRLI